MLTLKFEGTVGASENPLLNVWHVLAIYIIAIFIIYAYLRISLENLTRKRMLTKTGEREAIQLLNNAVIFFFILGVLIILTNASVMVLATAIVIASILLSMGDLFRSMIAYYIVMFSKIIENGTFVVMSRGIKGWVRRISTFYTELQGEHGEIIRVPNTMIMNDVIRMPIKAVPITFLLIVKGRWDNLDEINMIIKKDLEVVKRFSVGTPHFKLRAVSSERLEYELTFWIHSTEATGEILKTLAPKLINELKGMGLDAEIRVERVAAVAHM